MSKIQVYWQTEHYGTVEMIDGRMAVAGEKAEALRNLFRTLRQENQSEREFFDNLPKRLHGRWTAIQEDEAAPSAEAESEPDDK